MGYMGQIRIHAYMATGVRVSQAYPKPYPGVGAYWKLLGTAPKGVRDDGTPLVFLTSDAVHHGIAAPSGLPIYLSIKVRWPAGWREFPVVLTDSGQTSYYEPTAADLVAPPTVWEWVAAKVASMTPATTSTTTSTTGAGAPKAPMFIAPRPLPGTAVIEAQGSTRISVAVLRPDTREVIAQGNGPHLAFAAQSDPVEVWIAWEHDAAQGRTSTHLLLPAAQVGVVPFTDPAAPLVAPMEIVPLAEGPTPEGLTAWIPPEVVDLAVPVGLGAGAGLLAAPALGVGRGAGAIGGAALGLAARAGWRWWQDRAAAVEELEAL